jgi:hypothetical protein
VQLVVSSVSLILPLCPFLAASCASCFGKNTLLSSCTPVQFWVLGFVVSLDTSDNAAVRCSCTAV